MNRNDKSPITVVTPQLLKLLRPGVKWLPIQKEQATGVVERGLSDKTARQKLIESAADILGSGIDPKQQDGTVTGLVVGYVQSGKTLSFTTVMALACDNGFPLVILIAGNKDSLLSQSHQRLARDLNTEGGEGLPAWIVVKNPREQNGQYEQLLRQTIANWRDNTRDADEKPTLLLTVLKQNQRLRSLTALLKTMDLSSVPALVIDDEADQASLNTKANKGEESSTYARLRELRDALPCHTYLQYTATPQAPLLINIADTLSPDFVRVLEPGDGYVGGEEFFSPNSPYVKEIPPAEIPPKDVLPPDPPDSLLEALRLFFVGLSVSIIGRGGRRSMLIHPARETAVHQRSVLWTSAVINEWIGALGAPLGDPDRKDVLADFKRGYDELLRTEPGLPSFALVAEKLPRALRNTTVIEFNTRGTPKTPEIKWRHAEGWILVGGQAVDRGFTVDSLSVTYMPRGVGGGNADALQQRARFLGYKRRYLGICRIYLEGALKRGFQDYVEHEEIMRRELTRLAESGASLRSWRRRFVLDASLHPCRRSVISDGYFRAQPGGGWTSQRGALMTLDVRQANSDVIAKLIGGLKFENDTTYAATEDAQKHVVCFDVSLTDVVNMLVDYRLEDPLDSANFTGILVALGENIRRVPNARAAVYQMRPRVAGGRRTVSTEGTLDRGFQQGQTALAGGGTTYPGDAFFSAGDCLSIQIHRYDLALKTGIMAAKGAPLLAIHIPTAIAKDWLVQLQDAQGS